jgi:hypothetical protein
MPDTSVFFIGQQGRNLPYDLTVQQLAKGAINACKSMFIRDYTLCEVTGRKTTQELGTPDVTITPWRKYSSPLLFTH